MSSSLGAQETPGLPPKFCSFHHVCGLLGAKSGATQETRHLVPPTLFTWLFWDCGGVSVPIVPTPKPEGQPAVPPALTLSTRKQSCLARGRAAALWGCRSALASPCSVCAPGSRLPQGTEHSWCRGWLGIWTPCTLQLQTARTNLIISNYL